MRISDWSSDVCSSDLGVQVESADRARHDIGGQDSHGQLVLVTQTLAQGSAEIAARQPQFVSQLLGSMVEIGEVIAPALDLAARGDQREIGRASCRERVCQYV